MADKFKPSVRSRIMAAVRSEDTEPELSVRRMVHAMGYRYRLHCSNLPGKPDLVFSSLRKVVFVHGCFWHRHPGCSRTTMPKTSVAYWNSKFAANVSRDRSNQRELRRMGWKVLVVWECELKFAKKLGSRLSRFLVKSPP